MVLLCSNGVVMHRDQHGYYCLVTASSESAICDRSQKPFDDGPLDDGWW